VVDFVIIPFGTEVLVLDHGAFEEARQRGRELMPPPAPPSPVSASEILDAADMEVRTGIPASWFLEQARRNAIPHIRAGKYVRFKLEETLSALAGGKRDEPVTVAPLRLRRRSA